MVKVTDTDIELVEAIVLACEEYKDLWFKPGRREDGRQRYQDAKELAARHRIAGVKAALEAAAKEVEVKWGHIATPELRDAIRDIDPESVGE